MEDAPSPETDGGEINNIPLNPESIPQEISTESSQVIVKLIRPGGEGTLMGEAGQGVSKRPRKVRIWRSLHVVQSGLSQLTPTETSHVR